MELHSVTSMDSRPAPATDAAFRALQDAIGAQLTTNPATDGVDLPQLAPAIRTLCREAQRRGLRAEDVVILFKKAWAGVPGPEYSPEGTRRGDVLERAITLCIKSYYSTAD
jgi:hypothetical protein